MTFVRISGIYKQQNNDCFRRGRHVRWGGRAVLQPEMEQPPCQLGLSVHRTLPGGLKVATTKMCFFVPQAESLVDVSLAAEGKHLQAHKVKKITEEAQNWRQNWQSFTVDRHTHSPLQSVNLDIYACLV